MDYSQWVRCPDRRHYCVSRTDQSNTQTCTSQCRTLVLPNPRGSAHRATGGKATTQKSLGLTGPHGPGEGWNAASGSLQSQCRTGDALLSLAPLRSLCQRLEQDNATLLDKIRDAEDKSMKSATQQLEQYNRTMDNSHTVTLWVESQLRDAQKDLLEAKQRGGERLRGLRLLLQSCDERLSEVQWDLHQLREFRDREHPARELQIVEIQRQLYELSKTNQDQVADVEDLTKTELQSLLEKSQKLKENALQRVVQCHMNKLPLSLRRMCVENEGMKREIHVYQQEIDGLQRQIVTLREAGDSLHQSLSQETEQLCKYRLLYRPRCPNDDKVVLDMPLPVTIPI